MLNTLNDITIQQNIIGNNIPIPSVINTEFKKQFGYDITPNECIGYILNGANADSIDEVNFNDTMLVIQFLISGFFMEWSDYKNGVV